MNVLTDAQVENMLHELEAAHAETGNMHVLKILDIITPKPAVPDNSDKCPRCGTRHPLVVQFGYCGECARMMYE